MNVRIIFKPGKSLRSYFCRSRPHDTWECSMANPSKCSICLHIRGGGCATRNVVYKITCLLCTSNSTYIGETYRCLHDTLMEHTRAANRPDSYKDNAIGKHYKQFHPGCVASLAFDILDRQKNTVRRKISEARYITNQKPSMNDRTELPDLMKLLII